MRQTDSFRMSPMQVLKAVVNHPLNKSRPLRALLRFFRWQITSRLRRGPVIYEWVHGARFLVSTGESALTGNIYAGLLEFPEMGFLLHLLRPDDLYVDVGANRGSFLLLACAVVGCRGYAFEPDPVAYRRLVENVALNDLQNRVVCVNKGVGAQLGRQKFLAGQSTMGHVVAEDEVVDNVITIDICTLDDVLGDSVPLLLKVDVEGYEVPVLEGASKLLRHPTLQALILEIKGHGNKYGIDESQILSLLMSQGFRAYSYDPFRRQLQILEGPNSESGNTLMIRNLEFVEARLRTAPKFVVHGREI